LCAASGRRGVYCNSAMVRPFGIERLEWQSADRTVRFKPI
jgi:hypothetical protein